MQPKEYLKKLLRLHPLKVQMLSFLDISMCIEEHKFGFISSQIEDMSLLNNLLLCGDGTIDESDFFYDLVNKLKTILNNNVIHNPWFSKNLTNFEVFEHRNKIVCTLSTRIVKCIFEEHFLGQRPCEVESSGSMVESLSISLNINKGSKTIKNKYYYIIGVVLNCVDCKGETIHVKCVGLQINIR
jgi:hypothetical protein